MKYREHKCVECQKRIADKQDLAVITFLGFILKPVCYQCYMRIEKDYVQHLLHTPFVPINGQSFLVSIRIWTFFFLPLFLWILLAGETKGPSWFLHIFVVFIVLHTFWYWFLYYRTLRIVAEIDMANQLGFANKLAVEDVVKPVSGIQVIGLAGKAQAGKGYVALALQKELVRRNPKHSAHIVAFADPIKKMLAVLFQDIQNKEQELYPGVTYRKAMQTLGTEWGRKMVNKNIWIDASVKQLYKHLREHVESGKIPEATIIVDDVRFDNEVKCIVDECNGVVFEILPLDTHKDIPLSDHASEQGITDHSNIIKIQNLKDRGDEVASEIIQHLTSQQKD